MDPITKYLSDIYGTGKTTDELEKQAAVDTANAIADGMASVGMDITGLSDVEIAKIAEELVAEAEAEEAPAAEVAAVPEKKTKTEVEGEEAKEAAVLYDRLGKIAAHACEQERENISLMKQAALSQDPGNVIGSQVAEGNQLDKLAADRAMYLYKTAEGMEDAAAAGVGGGAPPPGAPPMAPPPGAPPEGPPPEMGGGEPDPIQVAAQAAATAAVAVIQQGGPPEQAQQAAAQAAEMAIEQVAGGGEAAPGGPPPGAPPMGPPPGAAPPAGPPETKEGAFVNKLAFYLRKHANDGMGMDPGLETGGYADDGSGYEQGGYEGGYAPSVEQTQQFAADPQQWQQQQQQVQQPQMMQQQPQQMQQMQAADPQEQALEQAVNQRAMEMLVNGGLVDTTQ